ncbi:integrase [Bacteroidia bacterium]|nr:integrase [Bacteroidia bacterium]
MWSYSKDGITVCAMLDTRRKNSKGTYPVRIRVNYKRVREYFQTGKNLSKEEWEKLPELKSRSYKELREDIENIFYLVRDNVEQLAEKGDFSIAVLKLRMKKSIGDTLNNAIKAKIKILESEERINSMCMYQGTLRLITDFAGEHIDFDMVSELWLKKCESHWLKTMNYTSIGMHMRNIRTVVNEAIRAGVIKESQYPFGKGKYEIKTGEARKKALNINQIGDIFRFEGGLETTQKYRDLWIFIYLCNGINVCDLLKLKYSNIIDNEICFIRQKTERTAKRRKEIKVAITPEMTDIIERWGNPYDKDNYIFPFLTGKETPIQRKALTQDITKRVNKRMKMICKALGIGETSISTYTARHSFATVLKRSGANIAFISESLGHNDLKTTEHYLASFECEERQKNARLLTNF